MARNIKINLEIIRRLRKEWDMEFSDVTDGEIWEAAQGSLSLARINASMALEELIAATRRAIYEISHRH